MAPSDPNVIYVTAGTGGVWKTKDGGTTWVPLTDALRDSTGALNTTQTMFMGSIAIASQDPRILYLTAVALREAGDAKKASAVAAKAAKFNGLSFNYAFVRSKAGKITTTTSQ